MKQPPKHQHFTGQPLTLTCWTHIDDSVDTPVAVTHNWIGPGGNIRTDSRKTVTGVIRSNMSCYSQLIFSYLRSSDSGSYHCQSTLHASSNYSYHSFISSSDSETESTTINAGTLKHSIRHHQIAIVSFDNFGENAYSYKH